MELRREVRRQVLVEKLSKRAACQKYGPGWQTLKKMLTHEEPPGYRQSRPRPKRKPAPCLPILERILAEDLDAPRKQRHTVRRLFQRLRDEHGYTGGLTVVQDAIREWRQSRQEVFLPLSHPPGEAQVDFGEAVVELAGERLKVALLVLTLPCSGAIFVQAFPRECGETFLEGHRRAFECFGGVPQRISYDDSAIAVIEVGRGRERTLTQEFLRLQSHYLFREHFCLVRRANEKGHVERLSGYARRSFLVPVPKVADLESLNQQLMDCCRADLAERTRGKPATKAELLQEDQAACLPLPRQSFEARRVVTTSASSQSLVRFDTNDYSVPVRYAHRPLTVVGTVEEVRIVFEDRLVARHRRCWERERTRFEPAHYLALLERKPGGFDFAGPLENWRLPDGFGLLRRRLEAAEPDQGTRAYIRVLRLLERFSVEQLAGAVEYALDLDVIDVDSIRTIAEHRAEQPVELFRLDGRPHLARVRVETTGVTAYQALLKSQPWPVSRALLEEVTR